MAITPDDLKVLHAVLEQARMARRACQKAANELRAAEVQLEAAEVHLDGRRVTIDVPCAFCPRTMPVAVTVGSGTVPLRDVCPDCARLRPAAVPRATTGPISRQCQRTEHDQCTGTGRATAEGVPLPDCTCTCHQGRP